MWNKPEQKPRRPQQVLRFNENDAHYSAVNLNNVQQTRLSCISAKESSGGIVLLDSHLELTLRRLVVSVSCNEFGSAK